MPIPKKLPRTRAVSSQDPKAAKTKGQADGSRSVDDDSPLPPPPVQFTSEQPHGPSVQTPRTSSIQSSGVQSVPSTPAAAPASQALRAQAESHIDRVKRLLEQNRRILSSSAQTNRVSGQNSQPDRAENVSVHVSIERVESTAPPPGRGGDDGYRAGNVARDGKEVAEAVEQQRQARGDDAAVQIQALYRGYYDRKRVCEIRQDREQTAGKREHAAEAAVAVAPLPLPSQQPSLLPMQVSEAPGERMMSENSLGLGNGDYSGAGSGSPRDLQSGPQQEQGRQRPSRGKEPLSLSDARPDTFGKENIAVRRAFDSDSLASGLPEMSAWIGSKDREEWLKALQVSIHVLSCVRSSVLVRTNVRQSDTALNHVLRFPG